MTKKLTGREAVIALMQGKKILSPKGNKYVLTETNEVSFLFYEEKNWEKFDIEAVLGFDHWEIVPEPMVIEWE